MQSCISLFFNHSSYAAPAASLGIVTAHVSQVVIVMLSMLFHCGCWKSSFPTSFKLIAQHIFHWLQSVRLRIKFH
jgi:hypothetical protein